MSGQSPYEVLRLLATNSDIAAQVRAYFKPRCDCNIVEWVKQRILAGDSVVVNAIKSMIQMEVVTPPAYPANTLRSANGDSVFLLRTWCTGTTRMGEFLNNDGTTFNSTIQTGDTTCTA